ncbi:MAG TPA: hypothetical protein VGQ27_12575 [Steroidobacteraceae bacterium]|jgi:hypothetical protein|nr:hypothetical protein [Steroidobacteraceae bacterium]
MRRYLSLLIAMAATLLMAAAFVAFPAKAEGPQANPLGLFFDNSFTNIEDYSRPGAMLITGNCNRYDERFQKARQAGAEVLAYLDAIEVYDNIPCKLNEGFYGGKNPPLWPFPTPGTRINWPKTHMTDMQAGSKWQDHVVDYISGLMREGKLDGVYLDCIGARLWSDLAQWKTWPKEEQDAWTRGNVDLVRRLDEKRREINPKFILIVNNIWDRGGGDRNGWEGEKYVDGVVIEHPNLSDYHRAYAGREFGRSGHRRVMIIARTDEDGLAWSRVPGVTNVAVQNKYDHPAKPILPFHAPGDR